MNVDFPHPEGPIIAVTALALTAMFMSFRACLVPNQAFRAMLCIFSLPLTRFHLLSLPRVPTLTPMLRTKTISINTNAAPQA